MIPIKRGKLDPQGRRAVLVSTIACPVMLKPIDERIVRLTALFVLCSAAGILIFGVNRMWLCVHLFALLLWIDLIMRGLLKRSGLYATIAKITIKMVPLFQKQTVQFVDIGPKIFAARLGMFMASLGLFAGVLKIKLLFVLIYAFFIVAAALEAFMGFCVGCWLYGRIPLLKVSSKSR